VPTILDAARFGRLDLLGPGRNVPAANAPPSATREAALSPQDLVARALAVLEEKTDAKTSTKADLPLRRPTLSDGSECPLPIRYFDAQYLVASFLTDPGRAAELLAGTGLQPVRQEDGHAIAVLFCGEYRNTDIGPYNEVGLTILSVAPGDPIPAIYVQSLPVTTARANRAGHEIWGFNKFVAGIDITCEAKKFAATVRGPDNVEISTFEGTRSPCIPAPPSDLYTFSMFKGKLLKTRTLVLTPLQVGSGDGFLLKVGSSAHPMAASLRSLGLDGKRPVLVQYADPAQALLFPGTMV
jgi:Acetoacetate decarboxylase (ADC)